MLPALIGTLGAALFVSWRVPLIFVMHILLFIQQAPGTSGLLNAGASLSLEHAARHRSRRNLFQS